ncbi:MAG: hypothetical protein MAG715_00187 [Methanonatronarchaeales archaeon]|nr:hypothetical protein [Methanonatronarchaeales archaeon]
MTYLGLDHGTSSIRLGLLDGDEERTFSLDRERGVSREFFETVGSYDVDLAAVTYSMGDGLTAIRPIGQVENRGVKSIGGTGKRVGAGTELFNSIRTSGLPTVVIPGLHDGSRNIHRAFRVYSHCASAEKVSVAYRALQRFGEDLCVADVGSNTVTVAVRGGVLIGGLDASVFAPGMEQGPIDLEAIRRIDAGLSTANGEFSRGGTGDTEALVDLVAMEMRAVNLLAEGDYVITGRAAGRLREGVVSRLGEEVHLMDEWSAALGGAEIARDVDGGAETILGIGVEA